MKKTNVLMILSLLSPLLLTSCDFFSAANGTNNDANNSSDKIEGLTLIDNAYYRHVNDYAEVMQFKDVESIEVKSEVEIEGNIYPVKSISSKHYLDTEGRNGFERYSKVTSLTIPEGITSINEYGLGGFSVLKQLTLPTTLAHLAQGALFYSKIEEITLPSFGEDYGYLANKDNILIDDGFYSRMDVRSNITPWFEEHSDNALSLTRAFYAPDKDFDPDTFHWDSSNIDGDKPVIKKVTISGGNYLFPYAFSHLTNLNEIHIPASIKGSFGNTFESSKKFDAHFESMEHFLSLICDTTESCIPYNAGNIFIKDEKLKDIIVPEGVKEIPAYSFYNFRNVEKISLPSTLESVGINAFLSFGSAKANYYQNGFYFGNDNNPYLMLAYTSNDVEKFVFHPDCQVFTETSFDNTRTYIRSVTFNDKIKVIPINAFATTDRFLGSELSEIKFSGDNNIEVIRKDAFYLTNIYKFTFGENIRLIEENALSSEALERIVFPDKVANLIIEDAAFGNWYNSNNEIVIPDGTVKVGKNVFPINIDEASFITVPKSLTEVPGFDSETSTWNSIFKLEHTRGKKLVDPTIYYEGSESEYSYIFDALLHDVEQNNYGTISLTNFYENVSFASGTLYSKGEQSHTFLGFLKEYYNTKDNLTIPDEITGLPVEGVKIFKKESGFNRSGLIHLNKSCKKLILTEFTPKSVVADLNLETIVNNEDHDTLYSLYFLGNEEDFKVSDTPSNVGVYYYSETANKDGKHWHWDGPPKVW